MRGKNMRCPTPSCRAVFNVVDANAPAPPRADPPPAAKSPPKSSGSGSVNDMVPMLPAQPAAPPPRPAPPAKPGHVSDYVQIEKAEIAPPASTGPVAGDW